MKKPSRFIYIIPEFFGFAVEGIATEEAVTAPLFNNIPR